MGMGAVLRHQTTALLGCQSQNKGIAGVAGVRPVMPQSNNTEYWPNMSPVVSLLNGRFGPLWDVLNDACEISEFQMLIYG